MAAAIACIIGWPASKSLSPAIHNAAFAAAGIDWTYQAWDVAPDDLMKAVQDMRSIPIAGANVTMPHKRTVMDLLDGIAPDAVRIGAINTIVVSDGRLHGENTDGEGFLRFLRDDVALTPSGLEVLILGAGGAARAIACALTGTGATVTIAARRPEQADEVATLAEGQSVAWVGAPNAAGRAGLIVNATPAGMQDDAVPIDVTAITKGHVVVDLIYSPARTPLLQAASARGATVFNGLGMLLHQAALSFERWTSIPAPFAAMSAAAHAAL